MADTREVGLACSHRQHYDESSVEPRDMHHLLWRGGHVCELSLLSARDITQSFLHRHRELQLHRRGIDHPRSLRGYTGI